MAGELILYTTGDSDLVVRLQERDGSIWLTQLQLAELFQTTVSNINRHIRGILDDYEQDEATIEEYSTVQTEGDHNLPGGAGKVSARAAMKKVSSEYDRWHTRAINAPGAVEQHFIEATAKVKTLAADKPIGKGGAK